MHTTMGINANRADVPTSPTELGSGMLAKVNEMVSMLLISAHACIREVVILRLMLISLIDQTLLHASQK